MSNKEFNNAFERVKHLAETYQAQEQAYHASEYKEAEVRKDFIDKFFIALGWDVNHEVQTNPYQQEVKVERAYGGVQRRADYAFYLAPDYRDVRFYVEAKKPSADIASDAHCFQAAQYGYSSKNPLSVLTDFEQFLVIDCRYKPRLEGAHQCIYSKYNYSHYIDREKFSEIYWLFSREALAQGSIEKYAAVMPKPRGKATQRGMFPGGYKPVDESLLEDLDEYRIELAHAFKKVNPGLDSAELTEITQRTLDRLVFLRFLEDKQIEPQPFVDKFGESSTAWGDFSSVCRRLDNIYNGIIFKKHGILDAGHFRLDDESFANICEQLCHLNSPYNFNAIPIHILGSIYEQFLGKVIIATGKQVHVKNKHEVREVRKAGGVFYTPEYIVRYIVENTVGKLIVHKTPDQIAKMRFADIACGSGSFLLGIYDLLLSYHGTYYNQYPEKVGKGDCVKHDGKLYLSLAKKREILLNNIYGVDISAQAVEVCQLSLYLKLLEEETTASAHQYLLDFAHVARLQKLLPDLSKNILCGNSLIGTDVLEGIFDFANNEERELNPMNFGDAFPEVMKRGGFDAVVGNPPYIPIESMSDAERTYFQEHYPALERKYDSSVIFILRALSLLTARGLLGYISSITWQTGENYSKLRRELFTKAGIKTLINLPFDVFKEAYVDTGVYVIGKEPATSYSICRIPKKAKSQSLAGIKYVQVESAIVQPPDYKVVLEPHAQKLFLRLSVGNRFTTLGAITKSTQGLAANRFKRSKRRAKGEWYPFAEDGQAYRYEVLIKSKTTADMRAFPSLKQFYEAEPKILIRRVINRQDRLDAAYFDKQMVFKKDLNPFVLTDTAYHPFVILAFLNSSLLTYLYLNTSTIATKDDFRQTTLAELRRLPVVRIDMTHPAEKERHGRIVRLVEQMLESKKQLRSAIIDKDKTYYENKCAALDRQIDRIVYDLYGLTDKEIQIVEKENE